MNNFIHTMSESKVSKDDSVLGLKLDTDHAIITLVFKDTKINVRSDRLLEESLMVKSMIEDEKTVPTEIKIPIKCPKNVATVLEKYLNIDKPNIDYAEIKTNIANSRPSRNEEKKDYPDFMLDLFLKDMNDVVDLYQIINFMRMYNPAIYKKKYEERKWYEHSGDLMEMLFLNIKQCDADFETLTFMKRDDRSACGEYISYSEHTYQQLSHSDKNDGLFDYNCERSFVWYSVDLQTIRDKNFYRYRNITLSDVDLKNFKNTSIHKLRLNYSGHFDPSDLPLPLKTLVSKKYVDLYRHIKPIIDLDIETIVVGSDYVQKTKNGEYNIRTTWRNIPEFYAIMKDKRINNAIYVREGGLYIAHEQSKLKVDKCIITGSAYDLYKKFLTYIPFETKHVELRNRYSVLIDSEMYKEWVEQGIKITGKFYVCQRMSI